MAWRGPSPSCQLPPDRVNATTFTQFVVRRGVREPGTHPRDRKDHGQYAAYSPEANSHSKTVSAIGANRA
ncbi:hypothetical protein GCM10017566_20790 [Amycolatopsis bartoniae]|uniref:Uncharacterized protein n=1 Tax=Amycolatopsis bartoniae TaxID=941986 RepID=A0A8H9M986_9PSEU|nr:hypothetical protein GCM10017566_20790 [Amycolatopsis bartoniae]